VGQFTGLFNGLDNTEPKPKVKANNTAKRNAVKQTITATEETLAKVSPTTKSKPNDKQANENAATMTAAPMRGKRSHPDYTQAPAFVRKDTYKAVKIALLNDERGLDYSDLIEELLTAWLTNKR